MTRGSPGIYGEGTLWIMIPGNILPVVKNIKVEEFRCPEAIEFIYASLTDKTHTAILKTGRTIAGHRWSVIGRDPFLVFESNGEDVIIHGLDIYRTKGDPFMYLQEIIDSYSNLDLLSNIPFPIGAIGAFSYDLKEILEDIPSLCADTIGCCDIHFSFFRDWIVTDEREKKSYKVRIATDNDEPPPGLPERTKLEKVSLGELRSNFTEEEYKEAITKVRKYIKEGTIYQANISQQFRVEFQGDSFHLFEIIEKFHATTPIFGVCLGMQAIHELIGASIKEADIPIHGKTSLINHSSERLFSGIAPTVRAGRYHSLIVDELAPQTEIIAETSDGLVMALKHNSSPVSGVQFHPESYLSEYGIEIVSHFLNTCTSLRA